MSYGAQGTDGLAQISDPSHSVSLNPKPTFSRTPGEVYKLYSLTLYIILETILHGCKIMDNKVKQKQKEVSVKGKLGLNKKVK